MSESPETPTQAGATAPAPRNSPLSPPAPKRLDPAAVMIGVGGVVLLLAVWWLLTTPRSTNDASIDPARVAQLEQRLGALEGVRGELGTLGGRLQALAPLEGRVQALETGAQRADEGRRVGECFWWALTWARPIVPSLTPRIATGRMHLSKTWSSRNCSAPETFVDSCCCLPAFTSRARMNCRPKVWNSRGAVKLARWWVNLLAGKARACRGV